MLSFIIPAHNEEAWIGRCLAAIETAVQSVSEPREVIVVDDASQDATAAIAREKGARVIQVGFRQISATRNAGAKAARGEVLFFVDADTIVNPEIIHGALAAVREGAAGGGAIPLFEGRLPVWFRLAYPVMVFAMRRVLNQTGGAFLFCTRGAFDTVGGFSELHYAAEEDVWVKSLKRHGRFVVLKRHVITSGRSLRTRSFREIARVFFRLATRGSDGFTRRDGLDIWYEPVREKPARDPE